MEGLFGFGFILYAAFRVYCRGELDTHIRNIRNTNNIVSICVEVVVILMLSVWEVRRMVLSFFFKVLKSHSTSSKWGPWRWP